MHATTDAMGKSVASPTVALWTDIFQATMLICVVGWVLDLPRRFGFSFYTEQLLATCLGLSLAISFINTKLPSRWLGAAGAIASLAICGYISARYETLTSEVAFLPIEGIVGSAILILLAPQATPPHCRLAF